MDTLGVGTLIALPVNLPLSSGIALATALIILAMFMLFSGDDEDFQELQPLDMPDLLAEKEAKDAILVNVDDTKETEGSA